MEWNFEPGIPIYSQIIDELTMRIARGEYALGEKLPSVRELALEAGVNPNTVQKALSEMERSGLVYTERASGRFVSKEKKIMEKLRSNLAKKYIEEFLEKLTGIGMDKKEIKEADDGASSTGYGKYQNRGNEPGVETKKISAYLPDRIVLPSYMTTEQLIGMNADFFDDFNESKAAEMAKSLNLDFGQTMQKMSKGTKEKLQLILTMSREAKLYLLDEPIGGVDPATRDYILRTIITNYSEDAAVIISTHLIQDVESIIDDVIFINQGETVLHKSAEEIREENNKSVDELFREVFKC